jgi:hypothetical protein
VSKSREADAFFVKKRNIADKPTDDSTWDSFKMMNRIATEMQAYTGGIEDSESRPWPRL